MRASIVCVLAVAAMSMQDNLKPIAEAATATLTIPGYVDFLAADEAGVWATNRDRVEKLVHDKAGPVALRRQLDRRQA